MDTICFQGTHFPCAWVRLGNAGYEGDLLVSTENLEEKLFDSSWNYVSRHAQRIDESIFFYVPDGIIRLDESRISDFILQNL